jgi:organic hydroperoxide reductase OsmC/OhrA
MIDSHDYQIHLTGTGAKTGALDSAEDHIPTLEVASPPEFGGPGQTWSPEHLFVASISSCLMTTFRVIAEIAGLEILGYDDDSTGRLQRGDDRLHRIESVTLRPHVLIKDEHEVDKAIRLLEKAKTVCLISRSVSSVIDMEPTIAVADQVIV